MAERRRDVGPRRRGKFKCVRRNGSARFVPIQGEDPISIWLVHLRAPNLKIAIQVDSEAFQESFERRISRKQLQLITLLVLIPANMIAIFDVLQVERSG